MSVTSQTKQHALELMEPLGPAQIAAVLRLLEVMVDAAEEPLTEEDVRAVTTSREHFRRHPEPGVSFEQFAAECGFTMDQILDHKE